MTFAQRLWNEIQTARADRDRDEAHWAREACGQDTEEAESSGFLMGYAEGLERARTLYREGRS